MARPFVCFDFASTVGGKLSDGPSLPAGEVRHLELLHAEPIGDEICCRYRVRNGTAHA